LLDVLGALAAAAGQARLAARLLGAAETVQAGVGASVTPSVAPLLARAEQSTRDALGTSAFEREVQAGRRLSRPVAIAIALGEPPPSTDAEPADPAAVPLGKRETEVAQLVADGLSNKQIGARLFISEHTVDSHIRSIMNKLGCRSRAQIAAWMATVN
jgi:DNA-binding NarL/FixJ family response regulator